MDSKKKWNQQVRAAENKLKDCKTDYDRALALGKYGDLLRLNPDTTGKAVNVLSKALGFMEKADNPKSLAFAYLRLGIAYQYAEDAMNAETFLRKSVEHARGHKLEKILDYCLQHLGKFLIEQGRVRDGLTYLNSALKLRRQKGDAELMRSTRDAIQAAETIES